MKKWVYVKPWLKSLVGRLVMWFEVITVKLLYEP